MHAPCLFDPTQYALRTSVSDTGIRVVRRALHVPEAFFLTNAPRRIPVQPPPTTAACSCAAPNTALSCDISLSLGAIRLDPARAPAATTRSTGGIDRHSA